MRRVRSLFPVRWQGLFVGDKTMKPQTKAGIDRHVSHGVPTGSFLQAVLENNLMEAIGRADDDNRQDLYEICDYIYNEIPSTCHGSPQKVKDWQAQKQQTPNP